MCFRINYNECLLRLQRQHQMQQQQQIVKQQSAPQPKMIRVLSSSNPSASQQNKTNENNFQLSFNNNEQQNVFSNYQNFFLNRDQHIYSNQSNSANSNAVSFAFLLLKFYKSIKISSHFKHIPIAISINTIFKKMERTKFQPKSQIFLKIIITKILSFYRFSRQIFVVEN